MDKEAAQPELTRGEYLRLLSAARQLGKERTYLIIKVLGSVGLGLQELPAVTVEAVKRNDLWLGGEQFYFPRCLRAELLSYAGHTGVSSGPIFLTGTGSVVCRKQIWYEIRSIGRRAGVPEGKANPRQLRRLCQVTQAQLQADMDAVVKRVYDQLLEEEQRAVGWERQAV